MVVGRGSRGACPSAPAGGLPARHMRGLPLVGGVGEGQVGVDVKPPASGKALACLQKEEDGGRGSAERRRCCWYWWCARLLLQCTRKY